MCKCKNIDFGSYDRQTSMRIPFDPENKKHNGWVCVDTCLVQEIAELWHLGIETTECCCGHSKSKGYIAVLHSAIPKMLELGYIEEDIKRCRPEIFLPKL